MSLCFCPNIPFQRFSNFLNRSPIRDLKIFRDPSLELFLGTNQCNIFFTIFCRDPADPFLRHSVGSRPTLWETLSYSIMQSTNKKKKDADDIRCLSEYFLHIMEHRKSKCKQQETTFVWFVNRIISEHKRWQCGIIKHLRCVPTVQHLINITHYINILSY